jgi:hypothetical protein
MCSQALNICIGYAAVGGMIAIDDNLPLAIQVKIEKKRLDLLQKMDEELPGHTQRHLECLYGGAPQITGSQEIAPSKRAPLPSASSNIQRIRKLPRNKLGETDVQALIKASWPTEHCAQHALVQGPTPPVRVA